MLMGCLSHLDLIELGLTLINVCLTYIFIMELEVVHTCVCVLVRGYILGCMIETPMLLCEGNEPKDKQQLA